MRNKIIRRAALLAACLLTAATAAFAQTKTYRIDTVAGSGKLAVPGEGIAATDVHLVQPAAMTSDGAGTVFILDAYFQAILRVDPSRAMTRFAGTGADGFSGDGGPATEATLRNPTGILATPDGELYISDASNGRVRKVGVDGIIRTFAGGGQLARSGDGGQAIGAGIGNPFGLALDSAGNLYFSDTFNHVVRKVDAATGIITTVAGSGVIGFSGDNGPATEARLQRPLGIALDATGNLYIADSTNQRIRKVTVATGIITTVAGSSNTGFSGDNGPAVNAWLFAPSDVKIDTDGAIYIADTSNGRIRRVRDGIITTVAGGGANASTEDGPAVRASLGAISGLTFDGQGGLITAETGNKRLRSLDIQSGTLRLFAGAPWVDSPGDGVDAKSGILLNPNGVAVDAAGVVYIADSLDHRVRAVSPDDGVIRTIAGNGGLNNNGDGEAATLAQVGQPSSLAVDSLGNLYIATPSRIRRVQPAAQGGGISTYAGVAATGFAGDEGPAISARLNFPQGLVFDGEDNLYFADTSNHRVRKIVRATGVIVTVAGTGTAGFSGDDGPAKEARLSSPRGVALDALGNLYIADSSNNRVRRVTPDGVISTVAGNGVSGVAPDGVQAVESRLNGPLGIAVDAGGNLWIGHGGSGQIRVVDMSTGLISTVAGRPAIGYAGDGGPATQASLNFPGQIAIAPDGRVFVADRLNYRVRVLTPEAPPEEEQ